MQREIDLVSGVPGGNGHAAPVVRALNQDVDLEHLPMTTVQQLHTSIQHDLEYIEQVMSAHLCFLCFSNQGSLMKVPSITNC